MQMNIVLSFFLSNNHAHIFFLNYFAADINFARIETGPLYGILCFILKNWPVVIPKMKSFQNSLPSETIPTIYCPNNFWDKNSAKLKARKQFLCMLSFKETNCSI